MSEDTRPLLARLDALLAGQADAVIARPPVPKHNPRHDLYGFRPEHEMSIQELLGSEHFFNPQPAPEKPAPPTHELYPLGYLAKMMGKSPGCIRQWIRDGIIPEADHWTRGKPIDPSAARQVMANGTVVTKTSDRRRFTSAQVMGLRHLADKHGITNYNIRATGFVEAAFRLWEECAENERSRALS